MTITETRSGKIEMNKTWTLSLKAYNQLEKTGKNRRKSLFPQPSGLCTKTRVITTVARHYLSNNYRKASFLWKYFRELSRAANVCSQAQFFRL